jgi:glycosyltransferase involved in cell wall biosynthesis
MSASPRALLDRIARGEFGGDVDDGGKRGSRGPGVGGRARLPRLPHEAAEAQAQGEADRDRDERGRAVAQRRTESAARIGRMAEAAGIRKVDVIAWRDLDDVEAGGSELHADEILQRWAEGGIDVRLWTSRVDGAARHIIRNGYSVNRRAGRYAVFPRTAVAGLRGKLGTGDGLVEIWNGMPFFSPVWSRTPRIVFLHHVHAEMWDMVLSPRMAPLGRTLENRIAPPFYRRTEIVTLSNSAKDDLVHKLRHSADRVTVVPPGVDPRFVPAGTPGTLSPDPLVVAVGRLVPVKRFDLFIEAMVALRQVHPTLEAVIVGEGYERPLLEEQIAAADAGHWISLPGRLPDAELVKAYQRAWVVASTSSHEGWGMTLTEAAACGTPAVATRIPGHEDAIIDDQSGFLVSTLPEMIDAIGSILANPMLRRRLSQGALRRVEGMTWERAAFLALEALASRVTLRR